MSIPFATTTISVLRNPGGVEDPYEAQPAYEAIASGVRGVISVGTGQEIVAGGAQEVVTFRLSCDPTDLTNLDRIEDETTGEVYEVEVAHQRPGLMAHTWALLKQVSGVVSTGRRT